MRALPEIVVLPQLLFLQGVFARGLWGAVPLGADPVGKPRGKVMSSSLLMTRRFAPLFWCQFFSAFSDNFLKNSLVFLILFKLGGSDALISLAAAVFIELSVSAAILRIAALTRSGSQGRPISGSWLWGSKSTGRVEQLRQG